MSQINKGSQLSMESGLPNEQGVRGLYEQGASAEQGVRGLK